MAVDKWVDLTTHSKQLDALLICLRLAHELTVLVWLKGVSVCSDGSVKKQNEKKKLNKKNKIK